MKWSAVILAGGESRRMGRDKAWVESKGQPLIARAVSTARELGGDGAFISGRAEQDYSALNCPVLLDRQPGLGPLGRIGRALQVAAMPSVLVLAADWPQMTPDFLCRLAAVCDAETGAVPVREGEAEPLAAICPKRRHALALDLIAQSRLAARGFAEDCLRIGAVRAFQVSEADDACFANWNAPTDVVAAKE